jgi:hypothetical protein
MQAGDEGFVHDDVGFGVAADDHDRRRQGELDLAAVRPLPDESRRRGHEA